MRYRTKVKNRNGLSSYSGCCPLRYKKFSTSGDCLVSRGVNINSYVQKIEESEGSERCVREKKRFTFPVMYGKRGEREILD